MKSDVFETFSLWDEPKMGKSVRQILTDLLESHSEHEAYIRQQLSKGDLGCIAAENEDEFKKMFLWDAQMHNPYPKDEQGQVLNEINEMSGIIEMNHFRIACERCLNMKCPNMAVLLQVSHSNEIN